MTASLPIYPILPGRSLGWITLGSSLHSVVSRIKAEPDLYPKLDLSYSSSQPILQPVILSIPSSGLRLRFDGADQRLRLIEVLNFSHLSLTYKNSELVRRPNTSTPAPAVKGPSFKQIYNRSVGPAYEGEYIAPENGHSTGTYVLSYPGMAFSFPVKHKAWIEKTDFLNVLSSSFTEPATSMAIFHGNSWPETRSALYTVTPPFPRSSALAGKAAETIPDEIEEVRLFGAGKLEFVRRSAPVVKLQLSETTPQDLVAEFGPPDAIYRKSDSRISIHATGSKTQHRRPSVSHGLDPHGLDPDQSSNQSYTDDSDLDTGAAKEGDEEPSACFYNYFHHGFDALISRPKPRSPAFPDQEGSEDQENHTNQLVVTKVFLHGNVPGSYSFNRHRRSRWKIVRTRESNVPPLNSEMPFCELSGQLSNIWHDIYEDVEEERKLQRGMVLNRGWGESPDSSIELLGGFEETSGPARQAPTANDSVAALNSTDLYGFPGMLFEVLKNDAVSCLTVY